MLVDGGASVNKVNHTGFSALHFACSHGQRDTISLLLKHGALHLHDNKGDSPLDMCLRVSGNIFF